MKKTLFLFLLCFYSFSIYAHELDFISVQRRADSLINILNTKKNTPSEQMQLYFELAEGYSVHDIDNCHLYAVKGLELAQKEKDKKMMIYFYGLMGNKYVYRNNYDSAIIVSQKRLQIAMELNDVVMQRGIYLGIGNVYARQGKFIMAIENYMKVIESWDGEGGTRIYALAFGNIGECYRRLNNPERAIYYLEQEKVIAEEINDPAGMAQAYRELGYIYLEQGNIDKALEYMLKALEIIKDKTPTQESDCREALIKIYILKEEYDKALEHTNHCFRLADGLGDPYMFVLAWNSLSDIYLKQKRYKECEDAALKAWNIDSTSMDTAPKTAENIAYANIFLGNKEKAALFFEKHNEIEKLKNEKSFHNALSDMEIKYETEKKELRIISLEKEKGFYILLIITGTIVLLMALATLFFNHKFNIQKCKVAEQQREIAEQKIKQLEQEKQLVATQAILDGETAERSRLARDLHDGLGGMLSVVKLNLKGYNIIDNPDTERFNKALDVLDQSIGELRRVAHHLMPESLMRYGLKVSLEDFCRAIPGANFQYLGESPRLESNLEILIYRCAYELVNNAVKYANASNINLQLMIDNGVVALSVQDNGVGFDPEIETAGTGLKNIRTRLASYNGKMAIHFSVGNGTEVCIEIENSNPNT